MCYTSFFFPFFFFFHVATRNFKTTYVAHSIHVGQQDARGRSQDRENTYLPLRNIPSYPRDRQVSRQLRPHLSALTRGVPTPIWVGKCFSGVVAE